MNNHPSVMAVSRSPSHTFSKDRQGSIRLIRGSGVEDDAHSGTTVKHRSRVARDPSQPNLRQVHLIHGELLEELKSDGFDVKPGQMGENVTTLGIDLLALSRGTRLRLGPDAIVEITGLRNPCGQLNSIKDGLMSRLVSRDPSGEIVRLAGVMSIVVEGGTVRAGDAIEVELAPEPHVALSPV